MALEATMFMTSKLELAYCYFQLFIESSFTHDSLAFSRPFLDQ